MPRKCNYEGCNTISSFNLITETIGLYCAKHKLDNMVNILNMKCIHIGCGRLSRFNLPNEKPGLYCSNHKLVNMVNVYY